MGAIVRRAVPEDAARIAEVHIGTWQVAYRGQLPDAFLDGLSEGLSRRRESWRRTIAGGPDARPYSEGEVWVAEVGGELAGFVGIGPPQQRADAQPGVGELYAIYVDARHWERGVGSALLAQATERLRAQGYTSAILWVLASNERARRFYEARGWRPDGGVKTETRPGGVELNEVRYRVDLAPTRSLA